MRRLVLLAIVPLLCCFVLSAKTNRNQKDTDTDNPELYIECVFSQQNVYERQPVTVSVTLFSSTPNVESAHAISEPGLSKNSFATLQQVQYAGNAYRKTADGKEYYCFPLKTFVFTIDEKGNYELSGGMYKIGVSFPVIINDPFWGRVRSSEVREFDVPVKKCSFKVKSLPKPAGGEAFSGSVGKFTLKSILPKGDIFVNEEATVYIVLRGTGMIAESVLPEYRNAFGNELRLKSVSESRDEGYDDGRLVSELRLECTFIPQQSGELTIGETYFDFFDPDAGKYVRVTSDPVTVKVKSTVSKRESLSI